MYSRPHDKHQPSPTRDHVLTIQGDDVHEGQEVLRILFTAQDASYYLPGGNPFHERLLVWERDRERSYFKRRCRSFCPSSPDSFLHLLPNADPSSWNLDFTIPPFDAPSPSLLDSFDFTDLLYQGPNFLARFPGILDPQSYPGPRFVSIIEPGCWYGNYQSVDGSHVPHQYKQYSPDLASARPYAFWVEDCYDPPVYVFFADDEGDAYDNARDWFSVYYPGTRIEESDYADYLSATDSAEYKRLLDLGPDNREEALSYFAARYEGDYDQWTNPVDVESLRMAPLRILSLDWS